jgi:NDP-sugar pyrophosphorylase family protein
MLPVVILAGGMGTRIASVAGDLPKALIPVAGRPFLHHQVELLRRNGVEDVVLLVGYRGELIEADIGDGSRFGLRVCYRHEPPGALKGTGGALVQALDVLPETFLLLYGDSYLPVDYRALVAWYRGQKRPAVMSVFRNAGQWDASNVCIDGDRVVYYDKKAPPGAAEYIDYGLSVFTREVIARYAAAALPLDLAVVQRDLVTSGELAAYEVTQRFYEIGKPEGWAELDALLRGEGAA